MVQTALEICENRRDYQDCAACLTLQRENRPQLYLWAIADGIGGWKGGRRAAKQAVRFATETIAHGFWHKYPAAESDMPQYLAGLADALTGQVARLQQEMLRLQEDLGASSGTTLTVCLLSEGLHGLAWNIGDSPAYHLAHGQGTWQLNRLCCLHNLAEEAIAEGTLQSRQQPNYARQVGHLTRCIGSPHYTPSSRAFRMEPGEYLLLGSDGALSHRLGDEEVVDAMTGGAILAKSACRLLECAREAGEEDNQTLYAIRV